LTQIADLCPHSSASSEIHGNGLVPASSTLKHASGRIELRFGM
jgi:hypothetical protein